jgi:diguanylate cyclase (GGDEF)-like protein
MLKLNRKQRQKTRQIIIDSFRQRSALSINRKVFGFYQRIFQSLGKYSKKNLILAVAEDFKVSFGLGRFAIFEWDHGAFAPIMTAGLNLRSIRPIRMESVEPEYIGTSKNDHQRNETPGEFPIDPNYRKLVTGRANLPEDMIDYFLFQYKDDRNWLLFAGEDLGDELGRLCLTEEFNKLAWPMLYDVYLHGNLLKKSHERFKELEYQLEKTKSEFENLSRHPKQYTIDPQSILEISNKLFSVYNEDRLIEIFVDFIASMLSANRIVVFTRTDDRVFKITAVRGSFKSDMQGLELSGDSDILNLIMGPAAVKVVPLVISEMRPENYVDGIIFDNHLILACRLYIKDDLAAAVMIGEKKNNQPYSEADHGLLSTMTNIACLAIGNIQQYRLVEKMSYTDSMTELYNYRYFYKRLNEEIYRAKRFNRTLALVIFDIDNFKAINDSFGHQAGDEILKSLAALVVSSVRAIDVVSRYGGEEFCIIMPDTGFANCLIFIERLRKMIANNKFTAGQSAQTYEISVSIGGATYPNDAQTADRLIYWADMALLKAKSGGRNRAVMYNSKMIDATGTNPDLADNNNTETSDES